MAYFFRLAIAVCGFLTLSACSHPDWARSVYDGQRAAAEQCRLRNDPTARPCATLPAYDKYEAERAHARGSAASR